MKARLDSIVAQLAGVTRTQAQGLIRAGKVLTLNGELLDKPGIQLDESTPLDIRNDARYVSRGGEKLNGALETFGTRVSGRIAIDVGASTGGFTDCLLQHGAAKVYAVDVGYGQLAWKLRNDPRVVVMERTNIRNVSPADFPDPPDLFSADCSFISLRLVLPPLRNVLAPRADGIVLIKPQFEAGREQVGRGGVVRDPEVHERVIATVLKSAEEFGFQAGRVIPSALLGPAGNREFLAELSRTD